MHSPELIVYLLVIHQNFPEHQFPSIVGRPILRTEEQAGDIVVKDIMCGDEAAAARSMLQISYPVRHLPGLYAVIRLYAQGGSDPMDRWRME
jgi:hypothetical protein